MPGFNGKEYPSQKAGNDDLFREPDPKIQGKFMGQGRQVKYHVAVSPLGGAVTGGFLKRLLPKGQQRREAPVQGVPWQDSCEE